MRIAWTVMVLAALTACSRAPEKKEAAAPAPVAYFHVDPATAGTVDGVVRFTGKRPVPKKISMDAEEGCEALHKNAPVYDEAVKLGNGGTLANVFVYVKSGLEGKKFEPPATGVVLDQHGCWFQPRVVALRTGQMLEVKNSDPVSHNIHPMPRNNRDWNQQQPPGSPDLHRHFAYPEVMIPVKCNIHSWMKTYIAVLDHPYFAVTGEDGAFRFPPLPPGKYTVAAWQESFGEKTQEVEVGSSGKIELKFVFP